MNTKIPISILVLWSSLFIGLPVYGADSLNPAVESPQIMRTYRLAGDTRYETAKAISEYYANEKVTNVILATGNDFADALSASVLAFQKEAPILLVDPSSDSFRDALDYVRVHLEPTGTIYLIGGAGIIGTEFETRLNDLGFRNIVRIIGLDRYDTSYKIARSLNDKTVSTVVISSGEHYADALSISSFAANNGWPILLTSQDTLPARIRNYIDETKPAKVYITGGTGVISDHVQSEIRELLPEASVERLTGESRFDTNTKIAETFAPNPSTVYLANGYGFADALAGSAVASKYGDPILFIDPSVPSLPKSTVRYLEKLCENHVSPNIVAFGGSGVVPNEIIENTSDLISGKVKGTNICFVEDINTTVTQNENYVLPKTVQAKLYNSDTFDVPVKWSSTAVDTGRPGVYVFEGIADGYDKSIKLNLTVKQPVPIAQYSTQFDSSQVNRTENIRLAAKALDGKQLAPGERFSFNESVGERTSEAGYKEALIIEGDAFAPGLGGGVCQVSSTLYNTVLLAHLEVIERHPHSLPVSYVPPGRDATVAFPVLDFKFRNNTDTTLLIRSFIEGNALTIQFYPMTNRR